MSNLVLSLVLAATFAAGPAQADTPDPLPSWNEGPVKQAIIAFVAKVTDPASPQFLHPPERVAVFDNDGTLWPENPIPFQLAFIVDELKRQLPEHPEWRENANVMAAVEGRFDVIVAGGVKALVELMNLTHAGMSSDEFDDRVRRWLRQARHPRFERPYDELAYAPMLEVLTYLRANGFRTWIVSGGGIDFMRVWAEDVYGIPPEWVIGSYSRSEYVLDNGKPTVFKRQGIEFIDDKAGKPVAIQRFIGRRPVLCFGNSDGDKAMLEWTTIGRPDALGVIVHHTDTAREYAYDAHPKSTGKLVEALADAPARGWQVVDMARDWKRVFRFEP